MTQKRAIDRGNVVGIRSAGSPPRTFCTNATEDTELADVLAEISRLMSAQGAVLTLHASAESPKLLGACVGPDIEDQLTSILIGDQLASFALEGALDLGWSIVQLGERKFDVLMLPVTPVDGHNRLVISVLFQRPSRAARAAAEELFASRQPLAMGYFRLWQLERLGARRLAALQAACDVTDLGMLFFTKGGTLDFVNAAAADLLDIGDGLRRHRQSVQASEISDSVKFQVALNHATAANDAVDGTKSARRHAPLVRLRRRTGDPLIAVIVAAEQRAIEPGDVAVMVYLFDPAFDMDRLLKPVCLAFKLSPVETRLACHMASGRSIADAAIAMKIKEQTARGYLKHIFVKTDTRRQTELVHLMLSNIFRVGRTILPEMM